MFLLMKALMLPNMIGIRSGLSNLNLVDLEKMKYFLNTYFSLRI